MSSQTLIELSDLVTKLINDRDAKDEVINMLHFERHNYRCERDFYVAKCEQLRSDIVEERQKYEILEMSRDILKCDCLKLEEQIATSKKDEEKSIAESVKKLKLENAELKTQFVELKADYIRVVERTSCETTESENATRVAQLMIENANLVVRLNDSKSHCEILITNRELLEGMYLKLKQQLSTLTKDAKKLASEKAKTVTKLTVARRQKLKLAIQLRKTTGELAISRAVCDLIGTEREKMRLECMENFTKLMTQTNQYQNFVESSKRSLREQKFLTRKFQSERDILDSECKSWRLKMEKVQEIIWDLKSQHNTVAILRHSH